MVSAAAEALDLVGDGPAQWVLPVTARLCAGDGRVFGGVLAAAAGAVAELVTPDRTLAVLSTEFLAAARIGDDLVLAHRTRGSSRSMTTSDVVGTVGERTVFVSSCVQVAWPGDTDAPEPRTQTVGAPAPEVRAPADCPLRPYRWPDPASLSSWLEVRVVAEDLAHGRALLWVRLEGFRQDGPLLALAADHVAFVGGRMLGPDVGMRTVQETVRHCVRDVEAEWVLVEVRLDAVDEPIAHGATRIWTDDGCLVALSEQTLLVITHREP